MIQAPTTTPTSGFDVALRVAEWLFSAAGGALITIVATRTKLAMMQRDTDDAKREAKEAKQLAESLSRTLTEHLDDRVDRFSSEVAVQFDRVTDAVRKIERRTYAMLEVIVDVARSTGADKRLGNSLLRMLADDAPRSERELDDISLPSRPP